MPKQTKKIKIYTHHNQAQHFEAALKNESWFKFFLRAVVTVFKVIYYICFAVGNVVVYACYYVGLVIVFFLPQRLTIQSRTETKQQMVKARLSLSEKLAKLKQPQVKFSLLIFILLLSSQVAFFKSAGLVAFGLELKGKVLGSATTGAGHLSEAQKFLQSQDVDSVQNELSKAINSFQQSQEDIRNAGTLLDNLLNIIPQKRDGQKLIIAAKDAAEAGVHLTEFYKIMQGFKITPEGISGENFASGMTQMSTNLEKAQVKLEQASSRLSEINDKNIPEEKRLDFVQGRQQLANATVAFSSFRSIFELFRTVGVGNKQVLVVFQNNNELRPTGGFMGTYGAFQITDGQIKISKISSIYDLDGQMKHNFIPPFPIKQVSPVWYLRDTNWFADFPTSAKKISEYYEKEGGETPDMVIALTPNLISDLLKITGPVEMPAYGVTLDSDNFVEIVQLMTSVKYDKNLNKPKQLLADFFPIFLQKISAQSSDGLLHGLSAIQSNLLSKHLMLYSRNLQLANQLKAFNWAGEIKNSDRDYLSIVYANLNGTKTDLFINQNISLETKIEEDGSVINDLTITRSNTLPEGSEYDSFGFIRAYVPEGSELISSLGFSDAKGNLETEIPNTKIDPDVQNWEAQAVKSFSTKSIEGREAEKTFFGGWVSTPGGKTITLRLQYRLPFSIKSLDRYSLLLQKQAGSVRQNFEYKMNFSGRSLEWKNFNTDGLEINKLNTHFNLNKDFFLGMVLSTR